MRLMRLEVRAADGGEVGVARASLRFVGLVVAAIPSRPRVPPHARRRPPPGPPGQDRRHGRAVRRRTRARRGHRCGARARRPREPRRRRATSSRAPSSRPALAPPDPERPRAQRVHPHQVMTRTCFRGHDRSHHGPSAEGERMTTAVRAHARSGAEATDGQHPADVLVVFGITGDLAKVMTFRSLYRLECRGLLDCPIVGVAVDDWSVDDLRERARSAIEATGRDGRRARCSSASRPACRTSPATSRDTETFERLAAAIHDAQHAGLLPRDPALPLRQRRQGPLRRRSHRRGARGRREAVRPRPRVGPRAGRRDPPVHRRVPAVPDRPLPREDGRGGDPLPALRQRDGSSRSGTATTSPRSRSRWPRASASRTAGTSTTRSARCATSWSTT